jgi:hypothetical protein
MAENLKLLRFYFVLLAIFTIGRWALSLGGADYDKTHQIFSLVILTYLSALYYAFIVRRFLTGGIKRAITIGVTVALVSQSVILLSTVVSYMAGMDTFWNASRALQEEAAVGLGQAMVIRVQGMIGNTVVNAIIASIGYGIAAVVPKEG